MWQDILLTIVSIGLAGVLIPQAMDVMKKRTKINLFSAGTTALGLGITGAVYVTMGFYGSALTIWSTGSIWTAMFIRGVV